MTAFKHPGIIAKIMTTVRGGLQAGAARLPLGYNRRSAGREIGWINLIRKPDSETAMNDPLSTSPASAAEDPFFVLRDCRTLFQRRLTETARLAGVVAPPVSEAFTEALGEAHDELAASNQRDGFEQTHGLTSSRITLMGDDDLELEIRIGEIARRLGDIGGNALWRVQLRYMTLLRRPTMAPQDNPVGPEAICRGLWAICRSGNAGLEGNFALLARIEQQLGRQLPALYGELGDLLASRNIEPAQTQIASSGGTRPPALAAGAAIADGTPNPLSALQNMLKQQLGGAEDGAAGFAPGRADGSGGNAALSAATLVMINQLAARLDQLELSGAGNGLAASAADADGDTPPRALRARDLDLPLGRPEAIALDTLALIFEAIFDTWELPDTVKTAIGRLQIPLLKLAIVDPSLFSDTEHPARRLINGMARAAVGLPRDVGRAHPVSAALWQLAGTVCETLQRDAAALAAPLAELDALIAERDRAAVAAAQPYLALLHEEETRRQAALLARRWLQTIEEQGAAPEILDFLRQYWVRVMEAASRADDASGSLWQDSHATVVDLLWSIQPKQSPDERKRLAGLLPSLLKRISAGLDRIAIPAEERSAFLNTCFTLQTAALRGSPATAEPPAATAKHADTSPVTGIGIELIDVDGRQLKILRLASQPEAAGGNQSASLQSGQWLQFSMNESEPLCGLICRIDPKSGNTLLFNPDWGYAIALPAIVLEQQLRDAQARAVSSQAIFDIAAERALKQLAGA